MMFGVDGTDLSMHVAGSNHQNVAETFTVTKSRLIVGPRRSGHFSAHIKVGAGSSPVGTLTVWYSNLPNPDVTNDNDWVLDTNIASINLATPANTFIAAGNVMAEYVRLKAAVTSGTISLLVWARMEGADI